MTEKEAVHILQKHSMLFLIFETNQQIPDASNQAIREIYSAMLFFKPDYPIDWCCGSCIMKLVKNANEIRKDKLKFYSF